MISAALDKLQAAVALLGNLEVAAHPRVSRALEAVGACLAGKITREDVDRYGVGLRLWQNLLATLSPML